MKSKAVLVLYNIEVCEIARYRDMLLDYELVQIVSPGGWGFSQKDAGFVDGGVDIEIKIDEKIDYDLDFDTILLPVSIPKEFLSNVYNMILKEAFQKKKRIVCSEETKQKLSEIAKDDSDSVESINKAAVNVRIKRMNDIETPIIVVGGVLEYTQKFSIQLELKKYLENENYQVAFIGSKNYSELFGGFSFPDFMFQKEYERNKILEFHEYVREIDKANQPDVMIIGIPGGLMPYNEKFPGYFGITLYEVMLAIKPDIFILSCLFNNCEEKYLKEMQNVVKYRFGAEIDCFNIAAFQVDELESDAKNMLQYNKYSHDMVDKMIGKVICETPIFNISNGKDGIKLAEYVTNKLSEYSGAELI